MVLLMELVFNNTIKTTNTFKKLMPYLFFLLVTIIGSLILFYEGYPSGDDSYFHFANVYDYYYQLKNNSLNPISSNLASGLGVGKQLFYAPLPHLVPALLGVILEPFGVSLLSAFKLTFFISVYISGIFMYRFSLHITKGSKIISILVATLYMLYPYRYFDALCRIAYAEALSFLFLPLFFMGIYDIGHMKKSKATPFIETIFGGALLFLTHNLTAFFAFVYGIIYLLLYIPNIIKLIKEDKITLVYIGISVFVMLGLMSVTLFQTFEFMSMDYYNVSVPERMWTNIEAVTNRNLDADVFSGFLNIPFLNGYGIKEASRAQLIYDILLFPLIAIIFIAIDNALKKFKYVHYPLALVVYIVLIAVTLSRIEVIIASILFVSLYSIRYIDFKENNTSKQIFKSVNFWYSLFMIILVLYMITRPDLWKILPKIFLNIQFPWRLWAFIPLYVSMLIAEIANSVNKKIMLYIVSLTSSMLIVLNMSYIEKRLSYKTYEETGQGYFDEISDKFLSGGASIGACLEYLPQIYYYNYQYKSEYKNSLYKKVSNEACWNQGKHPYGIDPAFLEGSGKIDILSRVAPKYEMNITINEDSLIQMPLFYYDGYKITALNKDTNEEKTIEILDVDSLISFKLEKGNYVVKTNYVGTKIRNLSIMYRELSIYVIVIFMLYDVSRRNRNKELLINYYN